MRSFAQLKKHLTGPCCTAGTTDNMRAREQATEGVTILMTNMQSGSAIAGLRGPSKGRASYAAMGKLTDTYLISRGRDT